MVLKPCARLHKQPMVLLHMVYEGPANGFKNHVQGLLNNPWFYCTWFRRAFQMVLRPCARPPKQPMLLIGPCIWF